MTIFLFPKTKPYVDVLIDSEYVLDITLGISLFVIIIFSYPLLVIHSNELNNLEKMYFNFLDLNNDKYISNKEANQAINLVFQLIDKDQDGKISVTEIIELKEIIELIK